MIIELDNITKTYINGGAGIKREVLKGISLSVEKGGVLSIVGPSGSGKSTLLNIIGTLDKASSGNMKLDDKDISQFNDNQLAELRNQKIGFIFQSHHLLPQLNILENVLVPTIPLKDKKLKELSMERALSLLEYVGLKDRMHQLPGQLSGGEAQRTAVVRALINEPEIILADEPTGSLYLDSAEMIGELLSKINKEKNVALIVVTHSLSLANRIGNIYSITNGLLKKD
ncbi:MAG: ABC transporter [Marinilabiliales bacterium]|nr:MAG: ABC transporter [Marinilabiliales bacterium]